MVIEAFTDYVESYYDENEDSMDVSGIVDKHFEEFAEWAYDDFVLTEEERDSLLDRYEVELRTQIKKTVTSEFLSILNS